MNYAELALAIMAGMFGCNLLVAITKAFLHAPEEDDK